MELGVHFLQELNRKGGLSFIPPRFQELGSRGQSIPAPLPTLPLAHENGAYWGASYRWDANSQHANGSADELRGRQSGDGGHTGRRIDGMDSGNDS